MNSCVLRGFSGGSVVKNSPASVGDAGDMGSIPGLGRSPGGGNVDLLQSSCLENPMDRGAWWAPVHGVAKSQTWLSIWQIVCLPNSCNGWKIRSSLSTHPLSYFAMLWNSHAQEAVEVWGTICFCLLILRFVPFPVSLFKLLSSTTLDFWFTFFNSLWI